MSKLWRWLTPAAVAAGLVAAGGMPAATASTAGASTITINATSNYPGAVHGKVDGYTLVVYRSAKYHSAVISGTATTTAAGDVATLMGERFGARAFSPVDTPVTLGSGTASFSFRVAPSLATHYKVLISGADTGTSNTITVFVSEGGHTSAARQSCTRTSCTYSFKLYTVLVASAYRVEAGKHWYPYLTIMHTTRRPKYLYLTKAASVTKARRINAGEYVVNVTFHIAVRGATYWYQTLCVKDTEARDGLGLPGSHGCGASRVLLTSTYLG